MNAILTFHNRDINKIMKAKRKSDGKVIEVGSTPYFNMKTDEEYRRCLVDGKHYKLSDLDFNVEEAEEVTINRWLTRSKCGSLIASDSPECKRGHCVWYHKEGSNVIDLDETGLFDNNIFPSLTWESEPLEVTITIKPKKK